ncbi:hypothetical protein CI15_26825 [Paraburkholderia monticola]|uniref:Lipoprotein n=1 Tax=Paraburkholderia monticola TaxID=1399968 RepID=A0A149PGX0_9BURK|nr:hypothetical protein [Paraburkholderia monticola]KXU84311.1 hypothetical protein CI15_26825 [Paraburkholderia monticola]
MKRVATILSVVSLIASTCVFAQTNSNSAKPTGQDQQEAQPGTGSHSMDRAAAAGSSKAASGTLMHQREKGMSPQGASGTDATGRMKQ